MPRHLSELDMRVQCKQEGTAAVRTGKSICSFSRRMERLLELGRWMPLKRRVQKQELSEADQQAAVEGAGVSHSCGSDGKIPDTHASVLRVWERWRTGGLPFC